ncbi:hypothetical protein [Microbacterium istanbulense]|uniref:hypothetical protein n=1 Tax=Microbacterium istanbulense TaxID=3122049 RepID=UPI003076BA3A
MIARYRLLGGQICNPCYSWLRRHPAPCPHCTHTRVLAHLDARGIAVCSPCAGQPGRFGCRTCGREESLQGSHCAPCRLDSRLSALLDDGTGNVAESLRPLHSYLLAVGGSDTVLKWIRREPVPSILRAMATGTAALSHQTLDALAPSTKLRYFRRTLMSAGVLPEIDVFLHDLETYGTRLFATLPAAHSALLGRFFRWRMLPLIRRSLQGRTLTSPMFSARRAQLRYISEFLQWLDTHGMTIETVDQPAIDRFVSADRVRQQIGPFVTWAVQERIAPKVAVTTIRSRGAGSHLSDPDLAEITARVLADETIPLPTRLITLFAVVFAQPVEASIALTRNQVVDGSAAMTMTFARTPIPVPDRLAALVRAQLRELDARPSRHPDTHGWLFPGTMPNQHVTAASIELVASRHGLALRHFRSSRLQHFAHTVPASVLADVVGVTADTAYRRSVDAGGAWRDYPPLRDIEESQRSLQKFHSPEPGFRR